MFFWFCYFSMSQLEETCENVVDGVLFLISFILFKLIYKMETVLVITIHFDCLCLLDSVEQVMIA